MKCQKCPNAATLHITEIVSEDHVEELHLCEVCAHKYLSDPQPKLTGKSVAAVSSEDAEEASSNIHRECDLCGIKFVDFRNTGRLGCPHDYEVFREELTPLLENIHGDVKHCGKTPRRHPQSKELLGELMHLRNQLKQAVTKEDYEAAAKLRDQIRQLE